MKKLWVPTDWKCRLAYCLNDSNDLKQLEALLVLINTDDVELFEISLDSIRSFQDGLEIIQQDELIVKKIEALIPEAGAPAKKIFQAILKQ